MPILSHNDIASVHIRVPSSSSDCAAFFSEAGLDNDKETATFDKDEDPNLVTDDEASIDSDTNHRDNEDFTKTGLSPPQRELSQIRWPQKQLGQMILTLTKTTHSARQKSTLTRRRSWIICQPSVAASPQVQPRFFWKDQSVGTTRNSRPKTSRRSEPLLFSMSPRKGPKVCMAWKAQEISKSTSEVQPSKQVWTSCFSRHDAQSHPWRAKWFSHRQAPSLCGSLRGSLLGCWFHSFQKTQSAEETLEGKLAFERHCQLMGHKALHCHTDNGIFVSKARQESCAKSGQVFTHSGVNAHFQTGIAERRIGETARATMIHAQHRWKQALQNQQQIKGKWKHRSRVGVHLGWSPLHAATVALVLSLQTGRVSPQFHVQLDPAFQTVKSSFGGRSPESRWQRICGFVSDSLTKRKDATDGPVWAPEPVVVQVPSDLLDAQAADLDAEDDDRSVLTIDSLQDEGLQTDEDQTLRRSNRVRKPVERFKFEAMLAEVMDVTTDSEGAEFEDPSAPAPGEIFCMKTMFSDDTEQPEHPLLAFGASNDPDKLCLHEAMRAPDKKQFLEAMVKEFNGQRDNGEVCKHKARLNLDGSKQVCGRDHDETCSPVAQWPVIRSMLIESLKHNCVTKQLDFVQAFP